MKQLAIVDDGFIERNMIKCYITSLAATLTAGTTSRCSLLPDPGYNYMFFVHLF
jgi:hypothetical protein